MDLKKTWEKILPLLPIKEIEKTIVLDVLLPMLENFVKDTSNSYDDKLVEAMKEWAKKNL